jgi:hypothetical protein
MRRWHLRLVFSEVRGLLPDELADVGRLVRERLPDAEVTASGGQVDVSLTLLTGTPAEAVAIAVWPVEELLGDGELLALEVRSDAGRDRGVQLGGSVQPRPV